MTIRSRSVELSCRPFTRQEWHDVVGRFEDVSLLQTWEYGEARAARRGWRVERAVLGGSSPIAAVQVLVRRLPGVGRGLAWINRGPLVKLPGRDLGTSVPEALAAIRAYWVDERGMYLRVAPAVEATADAPDLGGSGFTAVAGATGWASDVIDLSMDEPVLRARLRKNWRNQLSRAEREGLVVESAATTPALERFLADYTAQLETKGIVTSVSPDLIRAFAAASGDEHPLWVFEVNGSSGRLGSLLVAEWGGGSMCLAVALHDAGRAVYAGNLLYWEAVRHMRQLGCRWFDVGGADPEKTPQGILHFKQGLGGRSYRLRGEIEAYDDSWISRAIRWRVGRATL